MSGAGEAGRRRRVLALVRGEPWMMAVLAAVRDLALPDAWVGAGFVRARVWDALHGRDGPPALDDVDVVYFDPSDPEGAGERALERRLAALLPGVPWSVKNQARMHLKHGDPPYRDCAEALSRWLETPTCVAVRLRPDGRLALLAPHGLADLMGLLVRPTPAGRERPGEYLARLEAKDWAGRWPRLRLLRPDDPAVTPG
ncbi:MAG TPA: nucleotidyltransferase family protein [Alphaproteobacteria bacterium]|jgi:hypothetical protein|nr:nucleotidyltransferase family protein [Alphaproteobacteria bacterium]